MLTSGSASPRAPVALRALRAWFPWLVLVISLACTLAAWHFLRQAAAEKARINFEVRTQLMLEKVRQRMRAYEQVLLGGAALFAVRGTVDRHAWRTYVDALEIERSYTGIQAIGYAQVIDPAGKAGHIAAMQAGGFPDYSIKPKGERAQYLPTIYIEPASGSNLHALGHDQLADPVRGVAFARARDADEPSLTGKIALAQDAGSGQPQAGTLLCLPVYRRDAPRRTLAERRAALQGFVYGAFRMDDMLRNTLQDDFRIIDVEVFDGTTLNEQSLLFDGNRQLHVLSAAGANALHKSSSLEIGGRTWSLDFLADDNFANGIGAEQPKFALAGGGLMSLLLFALAWTASTTRERAQTLAHDITGALRESEARLEGIIQSAMDAIIAIDEGQNVVLFNPAAERVFGCPAASALGAPLDRAAHRAHVERFGATGTSSRAMGTDVPLFGLRADGEEFPIDASISQLQHGGRRLYTVVLRDVTQRKQVEAALRESEARFKSLTVLSSDWYWEQDAQFRFTHSTDPAWQEGESALGKKRWELPFLDISEQEWNGHRALLEAHKPFHDLVLKHQDRSGRMRYVSVSGEPVFDTQGNFKGYRGVGSDITAQREAQNALLAANQFNEEVMNSVNEGLAVYDRDLHAVEWNRFLAEFTGVPREAAMGRHIYELFPALRSSDINPYFERALAGETVVAREPRAHLRGTTEYLPVPVDPERGADPGVAWTLSSFAPHRNQAGDIVGVIVTVLDVTELKRNQDLITASHEKLRQLWSQMESARGAAPTRIAREIHDDLGATLTGIKMDLSAAGDLLKEDLTALEARLAKSAQLADSAVRATRRIINDLRPSILDNLGVWAAIDWQAHEIADRAGIACSVAIEEALQEQSLPAPQNTALFRIIQEALNNVWRHAGARHVEVRARKESGAVVVEIADDGKGIAPSELTRSGHFGILGMHERARSHGGEVTLGNSPWGGTLVTVRMPLQAGPDGMDEANGTQGGAP